MKKLLLKILRWFNLDKIFPITKLAEYTKDNPQKLANWLVKHIRWIKDRSTKNHWEDPEIALKRGWCDCEELACIVYEVLLKWGWQAHIITVWNKDKCHAVCAFQEVHGFGGKWCYTDFGGLTVTTARSLPEISECIYKDWIGWAVCDMTGFPVSEVKRM